MELAGRTVKFWLSPAGKAEMAGMISKQDVLEAFVVDEDQQGVWIWLSSEGDSPDEKPPVIGLLRWEHFWTASTEYTPQAPAERPPAGFRP